MSYRNPKIITPPNYGEIFARNMQYGAAMIEKITGPLFERINKQRAAIKYGDTASFETQVAIEDTIDTGYVELDDITTKRVNKRLDN